MARKKEYLLNQCHQLGIPLSDQEYETANELMVKLREVICSGRDLLPQLAIMKCKDAKIHMDYSQEKPWDTPAMETAFWGDNNIWVEPKLDGIRTKIHLTPTGGRTDSSRLSDVDYAYTEHSENFPHIQAINIHDLYGTVLDGEMLAPVDFIDYDGLKSEGTLTCTNRMVNSGRELSHILQTKYGQVRFVTFDILFLNGKDVRDEPLHRRRVLIENVIQDIYHIYPSTRDWLMTTDVIVRNKMKYFENCLENGLEGVVMKNKNALYQSGKRSNGQWKLKKFWELSGFITGYVPGEGAYTGLVGAVHVSAYGEKGEIFEFGTFSAITMELRQAMTSLDGSLDPSYLKEVVEVRAQEPTKTGRLRHCIFVRFREDLDHYECRIKVSGPNNEDLDQD